MIHKETHVAVVADNQDPKKQFRIKVKCAGLMGSEDAVLGDWVLPKLQWGFVIVPDIGEQVEIECNAGSDTDDSPGQAFLDHPEIRWTGVRFQGPTAYEEMFKTNYGKRRGFTTPGGHILLFDDTAKKEKINLVWHNSDNSFAMFSMDEDGSILLANKSGSMVYLNAKAKEVAVIDEHGNSYSSGATGIKLVDKAGDFLELNANNKVIQVQASNVYVGGLTGTEPGVLGNKLCTGHLAHIHPTGTGPSGRPIDPFPWNVLILSQVMQLK
jgi:Type VI secretion system/phage-baseplate injector OB domain